MNDCTLDSWDRRVVRRDTINRSSSLFIVSSGHHWRMYSQIMVRLLPETSCMLNAQKMDSCIEAWLMETDLRNSKKHLNWVHEVSKFNNTSYRRRIQSRLQRYVGYTDSETSSSTVQQMLLQISLFGYSSDDLGKAVNSQTLCNFSRCLRSRSTQAPNFCQPLPRSKEHVCSPTCRSSPPAPASQILCPVITQCNYPIALAVSFPGPVCGTTNLFPETGT